MTAPEHDEALAALNAQAKLRTDYEEATVDLQRQMGAWYKARASFWSRLGGAIVFLSLAGVGIAVWLVVR